MLHEFRLYSLRSPCPISGSDFSSTYEGVWNHLESVRSDILLFTLPWKSQIGVTYRGKDWTGIWATVTCSVTFFIWADKKRNKLNLQLQGEDEDIQHVIRGENTLRVNWVCGSPIWGTERWHTYQMWKRYLTVMHFSLKPFCGHLERVQPWFSGLERHGARHDVYLKFFHGYINW